VPARNLVIAKEPKRLRQSRLLLANEEHWVAALSSADPKPRHCEGAQATAAIAFASPNEEHWFAAVRAERLRVFD
jgi:hypothetical protein